MGQKDDLQQQARDRGLDDSGTIDDLKARLADGGDAVGAIATRLVAAQAENAKLEHSTDPGGRTTRDDRTDAGVPMLPGSPNEPVGPEDALGVGDKRGDYRDRVPGHPHESRPIAGGGEPVTRTDEDGNEVIVDYAPRSELVAQKPRTGDIGDVVGVKGGVKTDPLAA